ncbi:MAG: hypothetical protein AB8F78_19655 [Saprospiraceae bacterium]
MLRSIFTLLICAVGFVSFAQVERQKTFSLEAAVGFTDLEGFRVKSSIGFAAQLRLKPRFLVALTYERFSHYYVRERAADEYGVVTYVYDNSKSIGLYSGLDIVARDRVRLSLIAGPTVSGFYGQRYYDCGFDSCSKNEFSKLGDLGIGATLKGAYSFTRSFYGLAQFNGHYSLRNQWSRFGFRVGVGVSL